MKTGIAILGFSLLIFWGCKGSDGAKPVAGKGGNGTLHVVPRHHGRAIDTCIIYVKYDAVDTPLNNKYDDSMACQMIAGLPTATFTNLRAGNYFVYGRGWDTGLTPPQVVQGAFAYPMVNENDQTLDLAVSEN